MSMDHDLAALKAEFARTAPAFYEARIGKLRAGFTLGAAIGAGDVGDLRNALPSNGKYLPEINGDDSRELPVPATYVVGQNRRVAAVGLDVDYRSRPAPETISAARRAHARA